MNDRIPRGMKRTKDGKLVSAGAEMFAVFDTEDNSRVISQWSEKLQRRDLSFRAHPYFAELAGRKGGEKVVLTRLREKNATQTLREVLSIAVIWPDAREEVFWGGTSAARPDAGKQFKAALAVETEKMGGLLRVYGHNVAYDLGSLFSKKLDTMLPQFVGGRMIRCELPLGKKNRAMFLDSFNVWPMALKKVGKSVGLEKLDMDEFDRDYVMRDAQIVRLAMSRLTDMMNRDGHEGLPRATMGGNAVALWKISMERRGAEIWGMTDEFAREAYFGGRVELFRSVVVSDKMKKLKLLKGIGREAVTNETIWYLDINSLYPTAMLEPFPMQWILQEPTIETVLDEAMHGVADVTLDVPEDCMICPLPVRREDRSIWFPNGRLAGTWTLPEIRRAVKRSGAKLVEVRKVCGGTETEAVYADFIRTYYKRREKTTDECESMFFKLLMNNLYGQISMAGGIEKTFVDDGDDYDETIYFGTKMLRKVSYQLEEHVNWLHGTYVTSIARMKLLDGLEAVGAERLIYCDTDSMIFTWPDNKPTPVEVNDKKLGAWKVVGKGMELVQCIAPKMYRVRGDGIKETKAKGVPKRMANLFIKQGFAEYQAPWRMKESIRYFDRMKSGASEVEAGVWRWVRKEKLSGYDKKKLVGTRWLPLHNAAG
jgi:DNA polymerase type B, organellar and viral